MLRIFVIGRMAHLQILKPINQVVDHPDSVKIFLKNVMSIDRIDLSVRNCVVSIQTHVSLYFLTDIIYVKEKQRWAKDRAVRNS